MRLNLQTCQFIDDDFKVIFRLKYGRSFISFQKKNILITIKVSNMGLFSALQSDDIENKWKFCIVTYSSIK